MIAQMRHRIGRGFSTYAAIGIMMPKTLMAYSLWFWMEMAVQLMAMIIFVYFWRAVYASHIAAGEGELISGLTLQQTIDYILLAQLLFPLMQTGTLFDFGYLIREGMIGMELLRPLDFQTRYYAENLTRLIFNMLLKIPLLLVGVVFLGMRLTLDPRVWIVFFISMLLGHAVIFYFQWFFAGLAFYTTETWGLSVVYEAVMSVFSGALLPLMMFPAWLQSIAYAMPFAQAISIPVSLLSGVIPLSQAPRLWLVQLVWLAGTLVVSRLFFNFCMRKVTVQGG